ncbi:hypothetical protein D3C87_826680 [compost metagenome]|jgi:hypothetical protein
MKTQVLIRILLTTLLGVGVYAAGVYIVCGTELCLPYCTKLDAFGKFYSDSLRGSLFAGFLTLGGFLMSLKTFIIVNMKKEVYDSKPYQEMWREQKKLDTGNRIVTIYSPLRDLSSVLYITILLCVLTAVSQLTVGLFGNLWTSIFCVWVAANAIVFLIWCLTLIRENLKTMFDHLDKQHGD